jgi:ATP-dependent RNA helicase DDX18/HAS1
MSAKEAYKAYIRAYDSHHLKTIFDVHTLDLARVAQSFGFKVPPTVDLSMFISYMPVVTFYSILFRLF